MTGNERLAGKGGEEERIMGSKEHSTQRRKDQNSAGGQAPESTPLALGTIFLLTSCDLQPTPSAHHRRPLSFNPVSVAPPQLIALRQLPGQSNQVQPTGISWHSLHAGLNPSSSSIPVPDRGHCPVWLCVTLRGPTSHMTSMACRCVKSGQNDQERSQ